LMATGSTRLSAGSLTLHASYGPPGQMAVFFRGTTGTPVAAGDGLLCITSGAQRLAGLAFDILGHANLELDPAALGIAPGETWLFRVGYRDPGGPGGTGFNFSDGLRARFTP
jgi:hypothetical protein